MYNIVLCNLIVFELTSITGLNSKKKKEKEQNREKETYENSIFSKFKICARSQLELFMENFVHF